MITGVEVKQDGPLFVVEVTEVVSEADYITQPLLGGQVAVFSNSQSGKCKREVYRGIEADEAESKARFYQELADANRTA